MNADDETLRLFFALWPGQADAAAMMAWVQAAHARCGGRMMRQDTLHVTLAFLGPTPLERAGRLIEAASRWPAQVGPMTLRRFGRFTGPRIVWAGPGRDQADRLAWLDGLHDGLWARLACLGWQRPAGQFRPHVSLLRRAGAQDLSGLHCPPLTWTPAQCVLVASQPAQSGSYYKVMASMPLTILAAP